MAKLSARNRKELFRATKQVNEPSSRDDIMWLKQTYAFMSDGVILKSRSIKYKPDRYNPKGRVQNYGWKVAGKVKPMTSDRLDQNIHHLESKGYTIKKGAKVTW